MGAELAGLRPSASATRSRAQGRRLLCSHCDPQAVPANSVALKTIPTRLLCPLLSIGVAARLRSCLHCWKTPLLQHRPCGTNSSDRTTPGRVKTLQRWATRA